MRDHDGLDEVITMRGMRSNAGRFMAATRYCSKPLSLVDNAVLERPIRDY
jgi:hypothetical protein